MAKSKAKVEVYEDREGKFRFRVVGGNCEVVSGGQGYTRRQDAKRGVKTLLRILSETAVVDGPSEKLQQATQVPLAAITPGFLAASAVVETVSLGDVPSNDGTAGPYPNPLN